MAKKEAAPSIEEIQSSIDGFSEKPQDAEGKEYEGVMLFSKYPQYTIYLEKSRNQTQSDTNGKVHTIHSQGRVVEFKRNKALVSSQDFDNMKKHTPFYNIHFFEENELRRKLIAKTPDGRAWAKKFRDEVVERRNWSDHTDNANFYDIIEEYKPNKVGSVKTYGVQNTDSPF